MSPWLELNLDVAGIGIAQERGKGIAALAHRGDGARSLVLVETTGQDVFEWMGLSDRRNPSAIARDPEHSVIGRGRLIKWGPARLPRPAPYRDLDSLKDRGPQVGIR